MVLMSAIPNQLIDTEFTFFFSVPTHQIFVFFQANILFFWPKKKRTPRYFDKNIYNLLIKVSYLFNISVVMWKVFFNPLTPELLCTLRFFFQNLLELLR